MGELIAAAIAAAVGGVAGAAAAVMAFSTRLALAAERQAQAGRDAERDRRDTERALESVRVEYRALFTAAEDRAKASERRQLAVLELLVDVAQKLGVTHRFADQIKMEHSND